MDRIDLRRITSAALVVCGLIAGCAGSSGSPPALASPSTAASASIAASASSAASASTGVAFKSDRYGYSVELPAGWYVREEGAGNWTPFEIGYVGPGTDAFEEDYPGRGEKMDFPGITYGFYVSSALLTRPTTLAKWTDTLATTMDAASSCHGMPDRESLTVDGEPAEALVYDRTDCDHDHHVVVVGVIHGQMGYDLVWLAKRGEDDARGDTFDAILDTFAWEA
jgi:hypothetical protein